MRQGFKKILLHAMLSSTWLGDGRCLVASSCVEEFLFRVEGRKEPQRQQPLCRMGFLQRGSGDGLKHKIGGMSCVVLVNISVLAGLLGGYIQCHQGKCLEFCE